MNGRGFRSFLGVDWVGVGVGREGSWVRFGCILRLSKLGLDER